MSRSSGPSQRFHLLDIADAIGRHQELDLSDDSSFEAVIERVASLLREVRQSPIAIHGRRVETMFGYMATALGACTLVKREDAGSLFFPDGEMVLLPDYRLKLMNGSAILVEVKNFHQEDPKKPFKIRRKDLERLTRYSELCNCKFRLAIYWSKWRLWSLVAGDDLQGSGSHCSIDLLRALKLNRMGELGDLTVGTTAPLTLRVETDPTQARKVHDSGHVAFTIGNVRIFAGGTEITDDREQEFALYLYRYGDWVEGEPTLRIGGGELISIDFSVSPAEPVPGQGFDLLGPMSRMISNRYNELTTSEGTVSRLSPTVAPAALRTAVPGRVQELNMPLWVFGAMSAERSPPMTAPPQ